MTFMGANFMNNHVRASANDARARAAERAAANLGAQTVYYNIQNRNRNTQPGPEILALLTAVPDPVPAGAKWADYTGPAWECSQNAEGVVGCTNHAGGLTRKICAYPVAAGDGAPPNYEVAHLTTVAGAC